MMRNLDRFIVLGALVCICIVGSLTPATAEVLPYRLKIDKALDNGVELGDLAQSPTGELWVLERTGAVRVLESGVEATSLLVGVSTANEGGLLDVAFAADYASTGLAFLYYVDTTGRARVDEIVRGSAGLSLGSMIFDLGTFSGVQPGGGIEVGPDGLLYVGTGDLGNGSDAQNDGSRAGKVVRMNADGSGVENFAKGFRNNKDLAINASGQVYVVDVGDGGSADDEVNAVSLAGNYGWPNVTGPSGSYDDPVSYYTGAGPEGLESLTSDSLGGGVGSLVYACATADDIRQAFLTPDGLGLDSERVFYDPDGDRDGTPDALCPHNFNALAETADGLLYAANDGANPGIYRMWQDLPGPREVSAAGSPIPLTLDKSGSDLVVGWEKLPAIDVGRPARNGGQHVQDYQVWEGTLPIGTYDHSAILATDGTPDGTARLTATVTPGSGSRYYLVTAQGDNMESSFGAGRPAADDYCSGMYGIGMGECAAKWVNPALPSEELYLTDYNPNSPTYMQQLTMSDFKGRVVRMDISSDNCFWCNVQAGYIPPLDDAYRDRDLVVVTVFTEAYSWQDENLDFWPTKAYTDLGACATAVAAWAGATDEAPIVCDTDHNGDGIGDVSWQYWHSAAYPAPEDCGGTPQNFYVDQAGVVYDFVCGAELSTTGMEARIITEVNPESCE